MAGRLLSALLVGVTAALLPLSASATPDLRSELIPPSGSGWVEPAIGVNGEGPVSAEQVAANFGSTSYMRSVLSRAGYEAGYIRRWDDTAQHRFLEERVYLFGSLVGAGYYLGTVKAADEESTDWRQTYDTSSLGGGNSFGGYRVEPDGTDNTIAEFVPGDRVYVVSLGTETGPDKDLVLTLAHQIAGQAPVEAFTSNGSAGALKIVLIVAGAVLLVILAAVFVIVLLVRRRRSAPPPAASSFLSPDGNWWWDGTRWLPSGRSSIPPNPATPPTSPSP